MSKARRATRAPAGASSPRQLDLVLVQRWRRLVDQGPQQVDQLAELVTTQDLRPRPLALRLALDRLPQHLEALGGEFDLQLPTIVGIALTHDETASLQGHQGARDACSRRPGDAPDLLLGQATVDPQGVEDPKA